MSRFEKARWLTLLVPIGLLAGAYIGQYWGGLFPCEMCWWQRYPHFLAVFLALLAWPVTHSLSRRLLVGLAAIAIIISGLIGGFHAGVEYGWWDGLSACSSPATGTGDDLLRNIMNAPIVRCDIAPWTLLGISLAGYNFLASSIAGLAGLWLVKGQTA
jgi:disulfide bond formation protein DsbB